MKYMKERSHCRFFTDLLLPFFAVYFGIGSDQRGGHNTVHKYIQIQPVETFTYYFYY